MKTKKQKKKQESQQKIQLAYTKIVSEETQANHKVIDQYYLPDCREKSLFRF